jgi:hypothetical protein
LKNSTRLKAVAFKLCLRQLLATFLFMDRTGRTLDSI